MSLMYNGSLCNVSFHSSLTVAKHAMCSICISLSVLTVTYHTPPAPAPPHTHTAREEFAFALLFSFPAPSHLAHCIILLCNLQLHNAGISHALSPTVLIKHLKLCDFIQDYLSNYLYWSATSAALQTQWFPWGQLSESESIDWNAKPGCQLHAQAFQAQWL